MSSSQPVEHHTPLLQLRLTLCRFLQNGADVVVSATYQASIEGHMKRFGLSEAQAADLITEGVNLARRARNEVQETTGGVVVVVVAVGMSPVGVRPWWWWSWWRWTCWW